ncbi:hypothetical protein FQN57_006257 [Myotisia sp. PD_48]|nr:hypothetical protein FQN57_006257 [Myotisia sp. PD_48]
MRRGNALPSRPDAEDERNVMDVDEDSDCCSIASDKSDLTNLTDPDDYMNGEEEDTKDANDLAELLADNEHPPEYYLGLLTAVDDSLLKYTPYAPSSVEVPQTSINSKHRSKSVVHLDDLLAGFSANRPTALLKLCYRHIKVTLLKDPEGGPNNILIEFTIEFAKQFLGEKEETTFIIPEIIFDPSLVLSPHVMLLGLLFADGAFARLDGEQVLTSADQLLHLAIPAGTYQLELRLDPALNDIPVLRKSELKFDRIKVSDTEPLTYAILNAWIKRIGELAKFRSRLRAYSLRYGAGKALDNSGEFSLRQTITPFPITDYPQPIGHVSDAVRSLIFQHSDPKTFLKYYLHKKVDKDVRAIVQGLDPQQHIIRAACRMLRTVNPHRPQDLTTAQSRDLIQKRDRVSRRLKRPIESNKGTLKYTLYKKLDTALATARRQARDKLLQEIQDKFDFEEPLREIKRQLSGISGISDIKVSKEVEKSISIDKTMPLEQQRLVSALLSLPRETLRDEMLRRTEAIDAVAAYCAFEEGETCRLPHEKREAPKISQIMIEVRVPPPSSERDIAVRAVLKDHRPEYCFICLKKFSKHSAVTKHIQRRHLQYIEPGDRVVCQLCDVTLEHKMHLQNHAIMVHSTVT